MEKEKIIDLIEIYAAKHGLPPDIVWGIVMTESGFDNYAVRYEPHYKWLYFPNNSKPRLSSLETERAGQRTSYGLMQMMGAVFRESGYTGWLSKVPENIELQLDYGCRFLARGIARYNGNTNAAIVAYNAGSPRRKANGEFVNQYYLERVLKYAKNYRTQNKG